MLIWLAPEGLLLMSMIQLWITTDIAELTIIHVEIGDCEVMHNSNINNIQTAE